MGAAVSVVGGATGVSEGAGGAVCGGLRIDFGIDLFGVLGEGVGGAGTVLKTTCRVSRGRDGVEGAGIEGARVG